MYFSDSWVPVRPKQNSLKAISEKKTNYWQMSDHFFGMTPDFITVKTEAKAVEIILKYWEEKIHVRILYAVRSTIWGWKKK